MNKPEHTLTRRNLRDLVWMRTITIIVLILVILLCVKVLDITLPVLPLALLVAALSAWNLFATRLLRHHRQLSDRAFFAHMLPDVLALSVVLYLTGGASNPFAWVYLIPLTIASSVLQRRYAWTMGILTVLCYSLLMYYYLPLPGSHMQHGSSFQQHVLGMWAGFVLSAGLIAYFITDMASSLRERDQSLAQARERTLRDERLVALGTLAAGAAHELGTPLGSMAILSSEMQLQYHGPEFRELQANLSLFHGQIERCKQALSVISASSGVATARAGRAMAVADYLPEAINRWQLQRPGAQLKYELHGEHQTARLLADDTVTQALGSILDNAADASPEPVELEARWDRHQLVVEVRDQGSGLVAAGNAPLGKQPFTTKDEGLGLGLFLAHATVERLGGRVQLLDRPSGGTCTRLEIPLLEVSSA